eukprot:TRINITY_DN4565_c0_g1_i3.p1 TRINITY_DN4565_c0_g1~~TRINITY_DN4565_c0_g1_i3.p1  ORF type:complete len:165 (-),score=13.53 TRINITY_DN4565_c0_g1_i3:12-506(-)
MKDFGFDYTIILREELDGSVSQYAWQSEFYRCAYSILGKFASISAEFTFSGRLDFWISAKYRWGFELLRDNNDPIGHSERWTKGSCRSYISAGFVDTHLTINFRPLGSEDELFKGAMNVSYDGDNKQFVVKEWDKNGELIVQKTVPSVAKRRLPRTVHEDDMQE